MIYLPEDDDEPPIELHPGQSEIFSAMFLEQLYRFVTAVCARGWGKSYFAALSAMTAIWELVELDISVPNKNVYIVAPTFDQVKEIYYPILVYEMGVDAFTMRPPSRDRGRFIFPNNEELRLVSFEAVERLRGKGSYFTVNDEMSSWSKGMTAKDAWEDILQPMILTRWSKSRAEFFNAPSAGRALTITTPKGFNFVYDMFHYPETDKDWGSYHYDYRTSPYLDPDEIERAKNTMDPIKFATEFRADFKDSGTNVFYMFDRKIHVRDDIEYWDEPTEDSEGEDVYAFIDFNVGIMACSLWALRGGVFHGIDEFLGHPNTPELADALEERFKGHQVLAFPDPTGKARKSSAPVGVTDLNILNSRKNIHVRARQKSPPISDSVNAVNGKLLNANGAIGMYLHPRMKGTIRSMERTQWVDRNPDNATIDKSEGIEHYSDGVRYGVEFLFPVKSFQSRSSRGFKF